MQKKIITWITVLFVFFLMVLIAVINPSIEFTTDTKMFIQPSEEWELSKTVDGKLLATQKDNLSGNILNYSVTEFQRGDAVQFVMNKKIMKNNEVKIGDTIGYLYSNEEQRKLIQLRGQLAILNAELVFHTTGQKPEDIAIAQRNLDLAKQELETQRKLMARSEELVKDKVISIEQYDIDLNTLKVKQIEVDLAQANLSSVETGEKQEMANLIHSKINALNLEIDQIQARVNLFTITSPIAGKIIVDHGSVWGIPLNTDLETIVKVVNDKNVIGLMPVRLKHQVVIQPGAKVTLKKSAKTGQVLLANNAAQQALSSPYLYYIVELGANQEVFIGETVDVKVHGINVKLRDFLILHLNR